MEKVPSPKLNIQFGAYGSFQSFFGLADLPAANPDFYGVPDYASSMTFELVTNSTVSGSAIPDASDISVRFLFHNGTTSNISTPVAYPLFGQQDTLLAWNDFVTGMDKFAIGNQADWCAACGNTTGVCASAASGSAGSGNSSSSGSGSSGPDTNASSAGSGGMSNAVAGVIGAVVTLAMVLLVEALVMLLLGLRLVSKKALNRHAATGSPVPPKA